MDTFPEGSQVGHYDSSNQLVRVVDVDETGRLAEPVTVGPGEAAVLSMHVGPRRMLEM